MVEARPRFSSYYRPDIIETIRSPRELECKWPAIYKALERDLSVATTVDEYAELVRTASRRAGNAKRKGLDSWRRKFYIFKHDVLIQALRQKNESGLDGMNIGVDFSRPCDPHLSFDFKSEEPFRTVVGPERFYRFLGEEEYLRLFGDVGRELLPFASRPRPPRDTQILQNN